MDFNNFYEDYAFKPEDFEVLEGMYKGVVKALCDYIRPLQDNRIARYIEDYRFIPIQYIDISDGLYDIYNIFASEEVKVWNDKELSMKDRVEMLRNRGKYIELTANRNLLQDYDSSEDEGTGDLTGINKGDIVDFILKDPQNDNAVLTPGVDYYYSNNQLFLFDDYADPNRTPVLKMEEVAIDFNTVDDMLGKNLNLTYRQDLIPKIEFNDFVRILTLCSVKGFKINSAMNGISEIASISEYVTVFDRFTNDPEKAEMWNETEFGLGPFDFVIMFPLILDTYRVSLIGEYIDKIRHSHTNFQVLGYDFYEDEKWKVSSNFDDLTEDVIFRDWESDSDTKKFEYEIYDSESISESGSTEEVFDSDSDTIDKKFNDDSLNEKFIKWPTSKQIYTEGDRVVNIDHKTGKVTTSKDEPTVLNDANSRLGYADDEDKKQ